MEQSGNAKPPAPGRAVDVEVVSVKLETGETVTRRPNQLDPEPVRAAPGAGE